MNMNKVTSSGNNTYKLLRKIVRSASQRQREGLYLLEGFNLVNEAIMSSQAVSKIIVNTDGIPKLHELNISQDTEVVYLDDSLFRSVSDTVSSQGIIALMKMREYDLLKIKHNKILIIDKVQDPGNVGTLIRSADAFGFDLVLVTKGSCDIYNPKTVRSTMGSLLHIPVIKDLTYEEIYQFLIKNNIKIYATNLSEKSVAINEVRISTPFSIIIGNESKGVDQFWLNIADEHVIIPMQGKVESLNAGIAGSIAMYQFSCLL